MARRSLFDWRPACQPDESGGSRRSSRNAPDLQNSSIYLTFLASFRHFTPIVVALFLCVCIPRSFDCFVEFRRRVMKAASEDSTRRTRTPSTIRLASGFVSAIFIVAEQLP